MNKPVSNESACIEWKGAFSSTGYGIKWRRGKMVGAHRLAYENANGSIPSGLMVLHSCDNKKCVNPAHLRLGTAADNSREAVERGRIATGARHGMHTQPLSRRVGERNHNASTTNVNAAIARKMRANGAILKDIANCIGVSLSTASRICRGERYADALLKGLAK